MKSIRTALIQLNDGRRHSQLVNRHSLGLQAKAVKPRERKREREREKQVHRQRELVSQAKNFVQIAEIHTVSCS
eukprot:2288251-Pyramimonas_sp.AAC.2